MAVEGGLSTEDAEYQALWDVRSILKVHIAVPESLELMPVGAGCVYCSGRFVIELSDGLECWDCHRMAWININGSIARADFAARNAFRSMSIDA